MPNYDKLSNSKYYSIGYQLGVNAEKDQLADIISDLKTGQDNLKRKNEEFSEVLTNSIGELRKISGELENNFEQVEASIEKIQNSFLENNDNLLLTHYKDWGNLSNGRAISFNLLPSVLFIIVGLLTPGIAILIPDTVAATLMNSTSHGGRDSILVLLVKILIFVGVGGLHYLVLVKLIASRRYNAKGMPPYLSLLILVLVVWLFGMSLQANNISDPALLFLGINAFSLLPIGLSTLSFHTGKIRLLKKTGREMRRLIKEIHQILEKVDNRSLLDPLDLGNSYKLFLQKKEEITLGYYSGKTEGDKIARADRDQKEALERKEKIRKDLGIEK